MKISTCAPQAQEIIGLAVEFLGGFEAEITHLCHWPEGHYMLDCGFTKDRRDVIVYGLGGENPMADPGNCPMELMISFHEEMSEGPMLMRVSTYPDDYEHLSPHAKELLAAILMELGIEVPKEKAA